MDACRTVSGHSIVTVDSFWNAQSPRMNWVRPPNSLTSIASRISVGSLFTEICQRMLRMPMMMLMMGRRTRINMKCGKHFTLLRHLKVS